MLNGRVPFPARRFNGNRARKDNPTTGTLGFGRTLVGGTLFFRRIVSRQITTLRASVRPGGQIFRHSHTAVAIVRELRR